MTHLPHIFQPQKSFHVRVNVRRSRSFDLARFVQGIVIACLVVCGLPVQAQHSDAPDDVQILADQIDELVAAKWKENGLVPASPADDAEYLRRVWLDIGGRIPRAADARDFLEDTTDDKRRRLVDELLDGPNYVVNSTNFWRTVLIPEADTDFMVRYMLPGFEAWLRQKLADDTPYDDMVRELLTTQVAGVDLFSRQGELSPIAFYQSKEIKPENLAAATSRMFLGIRIECAQCHDHPFDTWKRKDFWGYATFFASLERRSGGGGLLGRLQELFGRQTLTIPDTNEVVRATFLTGESPQIASGSSPRITLADWITSGDNPYFSRTAANRVWGHFFGKGIVHPVDDFSSSNPPTHPELLDLLAGELVRHDFDLKFLMRAITASRTYQLTSAVRPGSEQPDTWLFSRMSVKGMTAEQLYDSIDQAVGNHESFDQTQRMSFQPTTRSRFIEQFSDNRSDPTERQTSVLQALSMMNGKLVSDATDLNSSRTLAGIAAYPGFDTSQQVEALFLATLNRRPSPDEQQRFVDYVRTADDSRTEKEALADMFWMLLNSSQFSLNH
ncbi:MAG: DUF1549 and DUF1553 domain-containing protein [Planctomycetaceae bacterium]